MYKNLIIIVLLLIFSLKTYSQVGKFPPKDETNKDASLAIFVAQLKKAVEEQNTDFIIKSLSKDVVSAIGEDVVGIEGFIKSYHLYDKKSEVCQDFFQNMKRVMSLGGYFDRETFVFPYASAFEVDEDNMYKMAVIIGNKVNLRTEPNLNSKIIKQLDYDIIWNIIEDDRYVTSGNAEWRKIQTYDKKYTGWVNVKYIYHVTDYRLCLWKKDGKWLITGFLEGD